MTNQNQYPLDEFDELGTNRVPQGVHRAPVSKWRPWIPFFVVLLIAPVLGYVLVKGLTDGREDIDAGPSTSQTPTDAGVPSPEPTDEETSPADDDPSQVPSSDPLSPEPTTEEPATDEPSSPEPSVELNYQAPISVLNGAGVQGLAGRTADQLTSQGWQAPTAGNYQYQQPAVSTVFHPVGQYAEEAQAIAEELGISSVVADSGAAPSSIIVVLRADFSG